MPPLASQAEREQVVRSAVWAVTQANYEACTSTVGAFSRLTSRFVSCLDTSGCCAAAAKVLDVEGSSQ